MNEKIEKDIIKCMRNEYNLTCSKTGILSSMSFFTKYFGQIEFVVILIITFIIYFLLHFFVLTFYFESKLSLSYFFEYPKISLLLFSIILIIVEYLVLVIGEYLLELLIKKKSSKMSIDSTEGNFFLLKFQITVN